MPHNIPKPIATKPSKAEVSRVMRFLSSKMTEKRREASRKNLIKARASIGFKYRKLQPKDILDIRKNCPHAWPSVKEYAKKYGVNLTTVWGILKGKKHSDDCLV